MYSKIVVKRWADALVMLAQLAISGCTSSGQMIAEGTIEEAHRAVACR